MSDKVGKNGNEVVVRSVEAGEALRQRSWQRAMPCAFGPHRAAKARAIKDAVGFLLEVYRANRATRSKPCRRRGSSSPWQPQAQMKNWQPIVACIIY